MLALLRLHPLLTGQLVQAVPDPRHHGWFKGLVINTGLLPSQIHVKGGTVLSRLAASQLNWVAGPSVRGMDLSIHQSASLPIWGWGLVLAGVLWPIFGFLAYRLRTEVEEECPPTHFEFLLGDITDHDPMAPESFEDVTDDTIAEFLLKMPGVDELQPSL